MSRFVTLRRPGLAAGSTEAPDTWTGRLAKYVPGDFLAAYTALIGIAVNAKPDPSLAPWIVLALIVGFVVIVDIYFYRKAPQGQVRTLHMIMSPAAFVALAYPIGAPLLGTWFFGWVSAGLPIIVAVVAAVWDPEAKP